MTKEPEAPATKEEEEPRSSTARDSEASQPSAEKEPSSKYAGFTDLDDQDEEEL